ncbi:MAG: sigma-70 family RNA polymerase sigma factor [Woeseiaceae bacterium]|nr:sigma-70 family RNA polymerase sigma factor [Woeseiaceae bacterium]
MKIGDPPSKADFHRVINARSDRWYSACLKITRDPDLAADAVQDALLNAWNKRDQFRHSARLDTWIHRIAVNAALNLLRKSRPGMFEALEVDVKSNESGPEQRLQDFELESELAASLARLTDIERICFVLKHLEQWRAREIAEELGTNEGRVKQAVFRAVRKLKTIMRNMTSAQV